MKFINDKNEMILAVEGAAESRLLDKCTIINAWELLVNTGACKTKGEAKRLIEGGAFKVFRDGKWVKPDIFSLDGNLKMFTTFGEVEGFCRVGKRHFFQVTKS